MKKSISIRFWHGVLLLTISLCHVGYADNAMQQNSSKSCFYDESMNFGVLSYNPYYKIYRSSGLGAAGLNALKAQVKKHGLEYPSTVLYMNSVGYPPASPDSWKDFKKLSGEKARAFYFSARAAFGLSGSYAVGQFAWEEEVLSESKDPLGTVSPFPYEFVDGRKKNVYLSMHNPLEDPLKLVEFPGLAAGVPTFRLGDRSSLYEVLHEILTRDQAILFHCQGGLHRTGMTSLMIRYLQGGSWIDGSPLQISQKEIKTPATFQFQKQIPFLHGNLVINNKAEYEYFEHNPNNPKQENLTAIQTLSQDYRFQCLKDQFSLYLNAPSLPVASRCYSEKNAESSMDLLDHLLSPSIDKQKLWAKCDRLKAETDISLELDILASTLKDAREKKDLKIAVTQPALDQVQGLINAFQLSGEVQSGDSDLIQKVKTRLTARVDKIRIDLTQLKP